MDLRDFIRLLRRRWRLVCAVVLVAVAAAMSASLLSTPVYEAKVEVFVSLRDNASNNSNPYQGNLFSQQRVKSYARIANSPAVTEAVVKRLKAELTAAQLAQEISAVAPTDTVLVDITVRDVDQVRARDLANAVAAQFATVVGDLERPAGEQNSPVAVTVVRPASVPAAPVSPRPALNLALGLVLGVAVGIGLAMLRDAMDNSVRTVEDLDKITGGSTLGVISFDPGAGPSPLVRGSGRSARGEAFRALRTNLRFVDVDNPPRSAVVTSSVAEEGKSTTACNLAITLAQAGVTVILVEGDLRRPRVAEYMGLEGAVGLTDVLIGRVQLDDVLQRWDDPRLAVLPSGALPPNPSELLSSAQMNELIAALKGRCDIVLIDSPPLLPVTDAAVLARECDGALLVVRYGKTSREQVSRSMTALNGVGARMLGTVLNMVPTSGPNSYGYGYSAYAARTDRPAAPSVEDLAAHRPASERSRTRVG